MKYVASFLIAIGICALLYVLVKSVELRTLLGVIGIAAGVGVVWMFVHTALYEKDW